MISVCLKGVLSNLDSVWRLWYSSLVYYTCAFLSKFVFEYSTSVESLYYVVSGICDDDVPLCVHGHTAGVGEVTRQAATNTNIV